MKKILTCLLLAIMCLSPASACADYVEGEVIAILNAPDPSSYFVMGALSMSAYSSALLSQAENLSYSYGLEVLNTYPEIASASGKNIVHLRSDYKTTDDMINELSYASDVESVHPNQIMRANSTIPNDSYYSSQSLAMSQINMPQVWDYATGSDTVYVAVFDSGIDYNHPDLIANMGRDTSGYYGKSFIGGSKNNNPMDDYGHGTHVAGIIGAVGNNGIGITGVNWKVKLLAVKIMDAYGKVIESDVIDGINYIAGEKAKGLNIRVVNMSFGDWSSDNNPTSSPYNYYIEGTLGRERNILCVMSAGNDDEDITKRKWPFLGQRYYPVCVNPDNGIGVGSVNSNNRKSGFSNYNSTLIDIAAPGENIYSTYTNSGYSAQSGTSMSAPFVTGAVALLCAAYPNETHMQIKQRILDGAQKIDVGTYWGSGVLDVLASYRLSMSAPVIGTSSLPSGVTGRAYNASVTASGSQPMVWSVSAGILPSGLYINTNTGAITGTPTAAGTFNFTVKATNAAGIGTKAFSINIASGAVPPVITTASLPGGTVGQVYVNTLTTSGSASVIWSITSGSLPHGLYLDSYSGVISGSPTTAGTFSFTVRATNSAGSATRSFSINIASAAPTLTITTNSMPVGTLGTPYNQTLSVGGTTNSLKNWSLNGGNLPTGLSLTSHNGNISGWPLATGTFNFTVKVTCGGLSATKNLSITVTGSATYPVITTSSLPDVNLGSGYYQTLRATGTKPITWSITAGSLPPGFSSYSEFISGIATTAGTYNFTVKATNMAGSTTKNFSIRVNNTSGGAVVGGFIETPGGTYADGESIHESDFSGYSFIRFVPIPSNATINSIEWESDYIPIMYPNDIESPIENYYPQGATGNIIRVTVNGTYTMEVNIEVDINTP